MIYLDHNATTPLDPRVLEAMLPFLAGGYGGRFGNPSSVHAAGRDARAAVDEARDTLARLLGAPHPREIVFTGGGTEADNLAVIGLGRAQAAQDGRERHLVTSQTEHHAVLHAARFLERHEGWRVTYLPVDRRGIVDLNALRDALAPGAALVSIHAANNETGVLQPVREIAALCRERGVPFHSDAVQAFGKAAFSIGAGGPGAISLAAHKFHGPRGAGLLWLRNGLPVEPILHGGAQENERRPGTENVAALVGMALAAALALESREAEAARQGALIGRLWQGIRAACPAAVRNGAWEEENAPLQLANTLNVSFPGLDGEALLINFDLEGICVSSGSACMAGSPQPSHVLLAMGVPRELARSSLRFSVGRGTTAEEIGQVIERLPRIIARCSL